MPRKPTTSPEQVAQILELSAEYGGRKISEITGISYGRVRGVLERHTQGDSSSPLASRPEELESPTLPDGPAVRVAVWDIETTDFKSDIGRLTVSSFYYPDEERLETRTFRDFDDGELGLALWTLERIKELDFIIGHNVKAFDRNFLNGVLARHNVEELVPRRGWWDTMLIARYGIKGLFGSSMANLADVLQLGDGKYKPSKNDWRDVLVDPESLEEIARRCEEDVKLNYLIWVRLKPYFHRWVHKHEG